uniref:Uncharacterized protein n=1 Tax=Rhizophora mucronata TaxID=61149 RepID=A0A2P2NWW1_RHIMU
MYKYATCLQTSMIFNPHTHIHTQSDREGEMHPFVSKNSE